MHEAEVREDEYWGGWTVNYGYYGLPTPGLAWVVESIRPSTAQAAREVKSLAQKITDQLKGRTAPRHEGVMALVFPNEPHRFRLRAEKTEGGWKISEYDYQSFEFTIGNHPG